MRYMIKVWITPEQIKRAEELYDFVELKNSVTKGNGNIYGAIGEVVVADFLRSMGRNVDTNSTKDYDMIVDGFKFDIKTKSTGVVPRENFEVSVLAYNTKQKCDFYAFVSVFKDLSRAYILGFIQKNIYYSLARLLKAGVDSGDKNKWVPLHDNYQLKIYNLTDFKQHEYEKIEE